MLLRVRLKYDADGLLKKSPRRPTLLRDVYTTKYFSTDPTAVSIYMSLRCFVVCLPGK